MGFTTQLGSRELINGSVFSANQQDDHNMNRHNNSLEWETATSGQVKAHKISGMHLTILRSPHVEQLSAAMKVRLDEVEIRESLPTPDEMRS